ncbi:MAG TPA: hypothetical protein VFM36_10380 [Thermoanaerobaculia bacterium]|nr:hypothetical protein [Thermoanaerobaculia bacterium]
MNINIKNGIRVALLMAVAAVSFSCSSEFTQNAAPVELVASNTQDLQIIDLAGDPVGEENCERDIGQVALRAIVKNAIEGADQRFNDVKISRYRVSYVRNDGGSLVPAPFVRSVDLLVPAGGGATALQNFVVFQADAVRQQPFVSLLPQNGGRDPETGRQIVRMDVIMDFFGETLAGSNVAGRTRFTLDFCYDCGGCAPKE